MPFKPMLPSAAPTQSATPFWTGGSPTSPSIVNPQGLKQKLQIENQADIDKARQLQSLKREEIKITEETKRLPETTLQLLNQAANITTLMEKFRDDLSNDKIKPQDFFIDPELKATLSNINSTIILMRSGKQTTDKERAYLERMIPKFTDFIYSAASGKPAKAVMINKLGALYKESYGLGHLISGSDKKWNDAVSNIKAGGEAFFKPLNDQAQVPLQMFDEHIKSIQQQLQELKGQ